MVPGKVRPYDRLSEKMASGKLKGKTVDWGASAAIATKQEILDFIAEVYGGDWRTDPKVPPREYKEMQTLVEYVNSLPEDGSFALVAAEL